MTSWSAGDLVRANRDLVPMGLNLGAVLPTVTLKGGVGDGTTLNDAAFAAALAETSATSPGRITIGPGVYRISSRLQLPFAPFSQIVGSGRGVTKILQQTAGEPVFEFPQQDNHSWSMSDMTIGYPSAQTNTGSIAVSYHHPGGTANGWYNHTYERLRVENAYRGWALADNDGAQTLWNTQWSQIVASQTKGSVFRLASATTIGQPQLRWDNIGVFNDNSIPTAEPAFYITAGEIIANGLDIEGWTDEALWFTGGTPAAIAGMHIEHHKFARASSRLAYIANGPASITDWSVAGATTAGCTTALTVFRADVNAGLFLQRGYAGVDTTLGGAATKELFSAGNGAWVNHRATNAGGLTVPGSSEGFYGASPVTKPTVTGSRSSNAALASLLTQLATLGLITDSTS